MDLGIEGKRAAVAGGSSGLGLAAAQALSEAGVHVAICGRDGERLAAGHATLKDRDLALVADVSQPEGAMQFIDQARDALGGIDILIPNAGGPPPGTFASVDLNAYREAISLNLLSVVAMCEAAVPQMQSQAWGRVVAITSISVRQPVPNLILSNTARAGATGFLKTLASEVAGDGVTVNSVQPGLHRTGRLERLYGDHVESLASNIPTGELGDPADFGRIVAFLCSRSARFVTGTSILVDGGAYPGLI